MSDSFQQRINRLEREVRDLKTAQRKPSTVRPYLGQSATLTEPQTLTIHFAPSDEPSNPLVINLSYPSIFLGAYDQQTNTQTVYSLASGSYTVRVLSNREITSIE